MPGNYPFVGNAQTFLNDFAINNANPAVEYGGTEANALYYEDREIAGAMYRVQNATYNKVAGSWVAINSALPCYGTALLANGTTQFISQTAGVSPFTAWTVVASVDKTGMLTGNLTGNVTGNVTGNLTGTVTGSASVVPSNADISALGIFNVKKYGAKGDGATDDTAAITAAINALNSNGGGELFFPLGRFLTAGGHPTITVPCSIKGLGYSNAGGGTGNLNAPLSVIVTTAAAATYFSLGSAFVHVDGLGVDVAPNASAQTGGAVFSAGGGTNYLSFSNLYTSNQWTTVLLNNASGGECFFDNVTVHLTAGPAINVAAWSAFIYAVDSYIASDSNKGAAYASSGGIVITGLSTGAFYARNILTTYLQAAGIKVVPSAASTQVDYYFSDCVSDLNFNADGFLFDYSTVANVIGGRIFLDSCWSSSNGAGTTNVVHGFHFKGGSNLLNGVILANCKALRNNGHGAFFESNCSFSQVIGGWYSANSIQAANTYNGIAFGASQTQILISGAMCAGKATTSDASVQQAYGISIGANCDYYTLANCLCTTGGTVGNQVGAIQNSPTSPSFAKISQCTGYNPVGAVAAPTMPASGSAQINRFGVDMTVCVTGGTVTQIAIGGSNTGLTSGSFRVPSGQSITITYSVAPTWTWFGD